MLKKRAMSVSHRRQNGSSWGPSAAPRPGGQLWSPAASRAASRPRRPGPQRGRRLAVPMLLLALVSLLAEGTAGAVLLPPSGSIRPATVEHARGALEVARNLRAEAEVRLDLLEAERTQVLSDRGLLEAGAQQTAVELEQARRQARQSAVTAYIAGGTTLDLEFLLDADGAAEYSWRRELLNDYASTSETAARRYRQLSEDADLAVVEVVSRADQLEAEIEQARLDLEGIELIVRTSQANLVEAQEAARRLAAGRSRDDPGGDRWARLRECESHGNYQAVSSTGKFRGAYQFSLSTWESVGGSGDPAQAPPAEQDARARALYQRSGAAPWPVCGRHLR